MMEILNKIAMTDVVMLCTLYLCITGGDPSKINKLWSSSAYAIIFLGIAYLPVYLILHIWMR